MIACEDLGGRECLIDIIYINNLGIIDKPVRDYSSDYFWHSPTTSIFTKSLAPMRESVWDYMDVRIDELNKLVDL